ncbi:hypothetical protein M1N91_01565 [Dehalococcoidia bacterium]|nr:hypothetical protein [Dehalococcoidia bacterium]
MPVLVAITLYPVNEVCDELAKRTGWYKKYSRQRVQVLIKRHIPAAQKIGKRYYLTEAELTLLATVVKTEKRRRHTS